MAKEKARTARSAEKRGERPSKEKEERKGERERRSRPKQTEGQLIDLGIGDILNFLLRLQNVVFEIGEIQEAQCPYLLAYKRITRWLGPQARAQSPREKRRGESTGREEKDARAIAKEGKDAKEGNTEKEENEENDLRNGEKGSPERGGNAQKGTAKEKNEEREKEKNEGREKEKSEGKRKKAKPTENTAPFSILLTLILYLRPLSYLLFFL